MKSVVLAMLFQFQKKRSVGIMKRSHCACFKGKLIITDRCRQLGHFAGMTESKRVAFGQG